MRIFLSWSGEAAKRIAYAIQHFIPLILDSDEVSFFYSPDVEKGVVWPTELLNNLGSCQSAIICITPENYKAPWIHFEAGAIAAKGQKTRPIFFGFTHESPSGPLAYFQITYFTKRDVFSLVKSLNDDLSNKRDEARLAELFDKYWRALRTSINDVLRDHDLPVTGYDKVEELSYFVKSNVRPLCLSFLFTFLIIVFTVIVVMSISKEQSAFNQKWLACAGVLRELSLSEEYSKRTVEMQPKPGDASDVNDPNQQHVATQRMNRRANRFFSKNSSQKPSVLSSEINLTFDYQFGGQKYTSSKLGKEVISYATYKQHENEVGQTIKVYTLRGKPQEGYLINPEGIPLYGLYKLLVVLASMAGEIGMLYKVWTWEYHQSNTRLFSSS